MLMDESSVLQPVIGGTTVADDVLSPTTPGTGPSAGLPRGRAATFTQDQRKVLLKYFEEYGMTSTHRRNTDLMERCAVEVNTTVDRVKNWIGSEAVKRKRKAGFLPRPKMEIIGANAQLKVLTPPPAKKLKRLNGYNVFFSNYVRTTPDLSTDFRERNAVVAQKWAELSEEERKQWGVKAEVICSSSIQSQELNRSPQSQVVLPPQPQKGLSLLSPTSVTPEITTGDALIERTLLSVQEKFDLLEQLGFEGYGILVNTGELQTHLVATTKGKAYHKMKHQTGKPLENPFIGYVFSEDLDAAGISLGGPSSSVPTLSSPSKRLLSALNSVETMQKSVMNAFALKYKVATGRSEVPYDNLQILGVQVYGMPPGIPFHSPLLYNQQQLQQILANLEKIVFLKIGPHITQSLQDPTPPLAEVEISTDPVASLVTPGHEMHIGAEEEAAQ